MRKLLILLLLGGCSSEATLTGVGAFTPNTQLTIGLGTTFPDGGQILDQLNTLIGLVDQGSLTCTQVYEDKIVATGLALHLSLAHSDESEVTLGAYQIQSADAGNVAFLFINSIDPDAGAKSIGYGASGTVTLTQISPRTQGSFHTTMVLFDDAGTGDLSGNFDSAFCGTQY